MVYGHFHEKSLTKVRNMVYGHFPFISVWREGRTHDFCQVATRGRTTPLQFSKVWDLGGWPYIPVVSSFFSVCLYIAFGHLDVWIQIWTVGTSNTLQTFWGETCRCLTMWNLRNHACHTCAPSTLAHSAPTAVLTLVGPIERGFS
jgi:hypothetical protein